MASLLDRLKGETNQPENAGEIPDTVPDDWSDGFAPDPVPAGAPPAKLAKAPKTSGAITPTLKKRIAAEIEMYIEFAAMPIVLRDPVCGGALHDQAAPIAEAVTQLLSKYPDLAHKFLQTGAVGDWLKLAIALQPVGKTIWEHHVTKPTEEVATSDGFDLDQFPAYRPGQ